MNAPDAHFNTYKQTYNLHTHLHIINTCTITQMKNCRINVHVQKFNIVSRFAAIDTIEGSADSSNSEM